MFKDPHMIYEIAKQKHERLLAEAEYLRKIKSSPNFVKKKGIRLGKLVLPFADLLIAIGVGLSRRFGRMPEGFEDGGGDDAEP